MTQRISFSPYVSKRKLRDYQKEVINELEDEFLDTELRAYLNMATGSGKTFTVVEFLWKNFLSEGRPVVWIAKSWPLLYQVVDCLISRYGDQIDINC